MMDGMMGGWSGFGLVGGLINVLLLIVILGLLAWAALRVLPTSGSPSGSREDRAEEILRERFAGGEIDTEEYERRASTLRGTPEQTSYEDYVRSARERGAAER